MKQYTVLSPFKDADGLHKPGDLPVSLSAKDAAELVECSAVVLIPLPAVPEDEAERQILIIEAIAKLDKQNADLWLRDNRPDISAITDITGWPITAAERNAAWATVLATSAA